MITEKEIDIVKLDLQGYELEAIKGCEKILQNVKMIYCEVFFTELYNNQPLFSHIDSFLSSHNFRLLNLYDLWTHLDGQLTVGDAICLNKKYFR